MSSKVIYIERKIPPILITNSVGLVVKLKIKLRKKNWFCLTCLDIGFFFLSYSKISVPHAQNHMILGSCNKQSKKQMKIQC